jgi:hypothetical protein
LLQIWQNMLEKAFKYMVIQAEPHIEIGVEIITAQSVTDRACTRFFSVDQQRKSA